MGRRITVAVSQPEPISTNCSSSASTDANKFPAVGLLTRTHELSRQLLPVLGKFAWARISPIQTIRRQRAGGESLWNLKNSFLLKLYGNLFTEILTFSHFSLILKLELFQA